MLLTLSTDLLYLISYHLSRVEWLCLIQCHSYFRSLTSDRYWQHRLQYDTNCLDYVRAKPDEISWREWYLISCQRYVSSSQQHDLSAQHLPSRPWYISQELIVDMLGRVHWWFDTSNRGIQAYRTNLSCKKMIGRIRLNGNGMIRFLILDNNQQLIVYPGLFNPGPDSVVLRSQVSEVFHLVNINEIIVVISTTDQQLYYFRGSNSELIYSTQVWTNVGLHWTGRVKCLNAYFLSKGDKLAIELITEENVHHICILDSFGWHFGIKRNKGVEYMLGGSPRLEMNTHGSTIKRRGKRQQVSSSIRLKWSNGVAQIVHEGIITCPHNFLRRMDNEQNTLGLVLSDK
jgi:hypothetical protein